MKTAKMFTQVDGNTVQSTSKDEFYLELANKVFPTKDAVCSEEQRMILYPKGSAGDDDIQEVSAYSETNTEALFKKAYGMSLKTAICKAEYLEYTDGDRTVIWAKTTDVYAKYDCQPAAPAETTAEELPEPTPELLEVTEEPPVESAPKPSKKAKKSAKKKVKKAA